MRTEKDQFEQIIKSEYDRIAGQEEKEIHENDSIIVPEGLKEDLYARIEEQKKAADKEKAYRELSEEDRKALELGRKMLEEEKTGKKTGEKIVKVVRKKRRREVYIALVAAAVLALGVGVISMGGPERIVTMVKQAVGDREVEKVNSSEENTMIIGAENEEEAYQKIEEEFGTYPVRIVSKAGKVKFDRMEFDEKMQTAAMYYLYGDGTVVYFINASYSDTSWGVDTEDEIIKTEKVTVECCEIEVKEYRTSESGTERHSAQFSYKGLEYFLIGTMEEEDFDYIVNKLFFINESR